jgi:hypothetical protein
MDDLFRLMTEHATRTTTTSAEMLKLQTEARAAQQAFVEEQRALHQDMRDAYSAIMTRVSDLELAAVEAEKIAVIVKEHEVNFVKINEQIVAIQGVYL